MASVRVVHSILVSNFSCHIDRGSGRIVGVPSGFLGNAAASTWDRRARPYSSCRSEPPFGSPGWPTQPWGEQVLVVRVSGTLTFGKDFAGDSGGNQNVKRDVHPESEQSRTQQFRPPSLFEFTSF